MKYVAITYDNQHYQFDQAALPKVEKLWESGSVIPFKEGRVKGGDIRRIEPLRSRQEVNQTSRLNLLETGKEIFLLNGQAGAKTFWQECLSLNFERKGRGKEWFFNQAIEKGIKESGFSKPKDIFDFLETEWDSFKSHNVPAPRK